MLSKLLLSNLNCYNCSKQNNSYSHSNRLSEGTELLIQQKNACANKVVPDQTYSTEQSDQDLLLLIFE